MNLRVELSSKTASSMSSVSAYIPIYCAFSIAIRVSHDFTVKQILVNSQFSTISVLLEPIGCIEAF